MLWRPLHEIDGGWFWWTDPKTPENTAKLWRIMFEYMVKQRGLHNLIWVYSAAGSMAGLAPGASREQEVAYRKRFHPGVRYVDIAGIDIYPGGPYKDPSHQSCARHSGSWSRFRTGKMLALCECAAIPDPQLLSRGPRWLYALPWFAGDDRNSGTWIKRSFLNDEVTNLSQLPGWDVSQPTPVVKLDEPTDGQGVPGSSVRVLVRVSSRGGPSPAVSLYAIPGSWKNWSMFSDAEILNQPGIYPVGDAHLTRGEAELNWKLREPNAFSIVAVARDASGKGTLGNVARVAVGYRNVAQGAQDHGLLRQGARGANRRQRVVDLVAGRQDGSRVGGAGSPAIAHATRALGSLVEGTGEDLPHQGLHRWDQLERCRPGIAVP